MIIAIDGPAASGKSTTAKLVAENMNLLYIDTGAMYRAVALYLKENNIEIDDFLSLEASLEKIDLTFKVVNNSNRIYLNKVDVSEKIRTPEITKLSSEIATIKIIRQKMVELQRALAKDNHVVLEGRDIGTVVFPDAQYKFYLQATLDARATRRFNEAKLAGQNVDFDDIKQDLIWRDLNDSQRVEAPLKKPSDAVELDTTNMSIQGQVNFILNYIRKRL